MQTLKGKTAVVTGAGAGIGRAIALALAEAGTQVIVADVQPAAAAAVRDEALALGVRALAVETDVSKRDSVVALADRAYGEFGRVDILCNNAGVTWRPFRTILQATMEDWNFILGVNLWGVIHGMDVFLPRMRLQSGEKHIVNTSSLVGLIPMAGHAPYCASKAAVAMISETAAQELASEGFGVTILCPGAIRTDIGKNSDALRSEAERERGSQVAAYDNQLLQRLAPTAIDPGEVGIMVRNAILDGTLYLNTQPVPRDLVEDRIERCFGEATAGRL